jgi:amidase
MPRPPLLVVAALVLVLAGAHGFQIEEATVDSIQLGFNNGSLTSVELVPGPDQPPQPAAACRHRGQPGRAPPGGPRRRRALLRPSPLGQRLLHGLPVLLKDNIATRHALNTTAGSFALLGSVVRRDASVVRRLRRARAVVLGKANMDEWANFRSLSGGGWSARGGQGRVTKHA